MVKRGGHHTGRGRRNGTRGTGVHRGSGGENGVSKPPFYAACWDFGHCNPSKCSGKKAMKLGLMRELKVGSKFSGVVISPKGTEFVSRADREIMDQHGTAVVECSWNRIDEIPWNRIGGPVQRLIPFLLAANAVNNNKPYQLNCVEALVAAFMICGHDDWAEEVAEHFDYIYHFLDINSDLFEAYAECESAEEVKAVQERYLALAEEEKAQISADKASSDDPWAEGNLNRRPRNLLLKRLNESDSENGEDEVEEDEVAGASGGVNIGDAAGLPDEEEEELAAIRNLTLKSKAFQEDRDKSIPQKIARPTPQVGRHNNNESDPDEDEGSDDEGPDDDATFDRLMNAAPMTDRIGLQSKQRGRV